MFINYNNQTKSGIICNGAMNGKNVSLILPLFHACLVIMIYSYNNRRASIMLISTCVFKEQGRDLERFAPTIDLVLQRLQLVFPS
jgi:hypothetical protein